MHCKGRKKSTYTDDIEFSSYDPNYSDKETSSEKKNM